jgi:hypothetical protein
MILRRLPLIVSSILVPCFALHASQDSINASASRGTVSPERTKPET